MQVQAAALTDRDKRNVAEFLADRRIADAASAPPQMINSMCFQPGPGLRVWMPCPAWNGWGPGLDNARFQSAAMAGLKPADVPHLKLKWAFGLPGGGTASSQPSVVMGRVFVGSDNGGVYSMDASSGCFYWSFAGR